MSATSSGRDTDSLEHFWTHGWMRVPRAFSPEAAARMRDAVWRALAAAGIERDRPRTWTVERPTNLQRLKDDPIFQAVGSAKLRAALDAIFEEQAYDIPKNWGAFFIAFPTTEEWRVPSTGWHVDAHYASALTPTRGVKTHALLDDVAPRGGGSLVVSGSHRLIHDWFKSHPPPPDARSAELRKHLQSQPYLRDLHAAGDAKERIARFVNRVETVEGVPLQVVENTGDAGDVIVMHPLVLHVAAPNTSNRPRFLLSGGITTDQWGWQSSRR